jgi:hypothetical protein
VYEYRAHQLEKLDEDPPNPKVAERYLTWYAQNRREQDVLRAELVAAGHSPDPPMPEGTSPQARTAE